MYPFDISIQSYLIGTRTPFGIQFMYLLTKVFDVLPLSLIILCVAIYIFKKRGILHSLLFIGSITIADGAAWLLKQLLDLPRPIDALIMKTDGSFPSGHATATTVFFGMLIFIFSGRLKGFQKTIFNFLCVMMVILVSFSRLYLGVHWFSDILGGIVLGVLVLFLAIKIFKKYDYFIG
jgi:undecaprenyl-diphosphatase